MINTKPAGSIILIGMPGTGKTTVGKLLAERLSFAFLDTDQLISNITGKTPRQLVEESGREFFLKVQDEVVLSINRSDSIIATGGGLVHSEPAMMHLKAIGLIVYLNTGYEIIEERMDATRKLVRIGGTLRDLYNERTPLYKKYADAIVDCDNTQPDAICDMILDMLCKRP